MSDLIDRWVAIDALRKRMDKSAKGEIGSFYNQVIIRDIDLLESLPSAEPEIIRCRDCVYGEQDDIGRWFCRSLGCQVGDEDGSGFCADGERREE